MSEWLMCGCLLLLLSACRKDNPPPGPESDAYVLHIPAGFPQPEIPADNTLTRSRIALGKRLFNDPILSSDRTRSCGSCHFPHLAFSDSTAVSFGIQQRAGVRNSPSLANVIYQKRLLREGGVPTLEMQVLVPVQEHNEFDYNLLAVAERMQHIPDYVEAAQFCYGRNPDPYVITRAIAAYERTMISGDSPFDRWFYQGNNNALSERAKRGYDLFQSERLNCAACHSGFLFTSQEFANNGLYEVYADSGRIRLTGLEADRDLFKIPSLRNVGRTAPYMHDGKIAALDAVIDHYQTGGKTNPHKSPLLKPFSLSPQERDDLLAFLNSLTDETFINNPAFR